MPGCAVSSLVRAAVLAAGLGIGSGGPAALACGLDCRGYGYRPGPVYTAPPVYSLTYGPYRRYSTVYHRVDFYATRVNIFRGPRWGYAAAYYNPRPYRGRGRCGRACTHRAYIVGPILRGWRRW